MPQQGAEYFSSKKDKRGGQHQQHPYGEVENGAFDEFVTDNADDGVAEQENRTDKADGYQNFQEFVSMWNEILR